MSVLKFMKIKSLKQVGPDKILNIYHGLIFELFRVTYVLDFILIHKKDKNLHAKARAYGSRDNFWKTIRAALSNFRVLCMCRLLDPDSHDYFSIKEIINHVKDKRLKKFYDRRYKKIEQQIKQIIIWRGNLIAHRTISGQFGNFGGGINLEQKNLLKIQNFLFDFLCWLECALYSGKISVIKTGYRDQLKQLQKSIQKDVNSVLNYGLDWRKFK